jgi:hypothetical protein
MSKTIVVRYQTRPAAADDNQRLIERVFEQLTEEKPDGVRYTVYRLADGVSFVHVVVSEDDSDPLPKLSAFAAFQKGLGDRLADKPVRTDAELVGTYRHLAP